MTAPFKTFAAFLALASIVAATGAAAHPHVFVDAKAEIIFDDQHRISAVRNIWTFDEAFSAYALQGLDDNGDGIPSEAELKPLAQENIESLARYDYFTFLVAGEQKHVFVPPNEYRDELQDGRLTLDFTLPLHEPVPVDGTVKIEVFDPEYFVAITLVKDGAISLKGAPAACKATYQPPHELDASTMAALAAIPIGQRDLPPDLLDAASALSNLIQISCPGLPFAFAQPLPAPPAPQPAAAAAIETVAAQDSAPQPPVADRADVAANDDAAPLPAPEKSDPEAAVAVPKLVLDPTAVIGLALALVAGIAICSVVLVRRLRSG